MNTSPTIASSRSLPFTGTLQTSRPLCIRYMRRSMIRSLALFFAFLLPIEASLACDGALVSTRTDDGKIIALKVSEEELFNAPKWKISDGEPPLSITQAYQAAMEWAKEKYKRYDSVKVWSLELKGYNCSTHRDRWLYVVEFQPIIDGNRVFGSGNWAAILMDGKVIGPVKE